MHFTKTYDEEIVFTETRDGVALVGAVFRPMGSSAQPCGLVLIHGNTG